MDLETGKRTDLPLPTEREGRDRRLRIHAGRQVGLDRDSMPTASSSSLAVSIWRRGKYEWLTSDIPWDVSGLEVDDDTGRVAFTVNADGASQLCSCSSRSRRRIRAAAS